MTHEQNRKIKELCRQMENRLHRVQLYDYEQMNYKLLFQLTIEDVEDALKILRGEAK